MLERMDDFFTARVDGYDEHMRANVEEDSDFYEFTASQLPQNGNEHVLDCILQFQPSKNNHMDLAQNWKFDITINVD